MSQNMESQLDESLLNDINNSPMNGLTQAPTSGNANASNLSTPPEPANFGNTSSSNMALLSPPGSRYAFNDTTNANPISPLLSTTDNPYSGVFHNNSNFNSLQRPLSAQDFNINGTIGGSGLGNAQNNSAFDAFRPFSAQGGFNNGLSSIDDAFNVDSGSNLGNVQSTGFNIPERPLSSMEIDSISFKNDISNFITWINTLNSTQHRVVIDNLLGNLPNDILQYTKMSLENYNPTTYSYGNVLSGNVSKIVSPQPIYQSNGEPVTLDSVLNSTANTQQQQQQQTTNLQRVLSPNFPTFDRTSLLQDIGFNRPRSADPYHSRLLRNQQQQQQSQQQQSQQYQTPSKSRSSNRFDDDNLQQFDTNNNNNNNNNSFDITNLAQQLTQTTLNFNDFNNANNLKLSALSTINSRAQLDSGKKRGVSGYSQDERGRSAQTGNNLQQGNYHGSNNYLHDDLNVRNSSSVPPIARIPYYETLSSSSSSKNHKSPLSPPPPPPPPQQRSRNINVGNNVIDSDALSRLASINSASKLQDNEFRTPHKNTNLNAQQTPKSPAINPKQLTNPKLLNDISAWLKSLRLHKYTSALQDIPWKDLIYLNDKQLEDKGVTALGARGKLLKAFDVVREAYESGAIKE